jgi:hypothetical protein
MILKNNDQIELTELSNQELPNPEAEPGKTPDEKPEVEPDALPSEEPGIIPQEKPGKEDDDDDDDDDPFTETEIGDDPDEIEKKTTIM